MGTWLRQRHEDQGVRILTSAQVESVIRDGQGNPAEVGLADGRRVAAELVVVGVGVIPRTDLAQRAGVDLDHGIAVDATGRSSNPWVYAAGDVAAHLLGGRRRRVEHWTVAAEQGRAAGRSIAGLATAWQSVPYFWSDQFNLSLQMFGLPSAGDTVITRRATDDRAVWAWVGRGRVTAVAAVNSPVDARAGRQLLAAGGHADLVRLADPSADLRTIGSDPAPTAG
jgi:3-phenylpropionate/trans-cinnamate dioxygenase ferredoxin reductase subunit